MAGKFRNLANNLSFRRSVVNVLDVELQRALRLEPGGAQGALELLVAVVGVFVTAKLRWSPAGYFADLKEVNRRRAQ
jgi:hypothetical protein